MTEIQDSVANDPRWKAFTTTGLNCSCGTVHVGLFPIHLHHPVGWQGGQEYEQDTALRMDGDFLSANFCVLQGKFFAMRMRLPFVIRGAEPSAFMFTAWASMDRPDFEQFVTAYRTGKLTQDVRVPARLVNRVGGFPDSYNLMGSAFQQADGAPPVLMIHGLQAPQNGDHMLLHDQRYGIGMERMLELFEAYGHDMTGGHKPIY